MSTTFEGTPASPGIVIAPLRVLHWELPKVPRTGIIEPGEVDREIERLYEACAWARDRIRSVQARTAERMGEAEAAIFDPQILMLEDADLVDAAATLIRENHLPAERAFEWRVLEWESQWSHAAHPMVMDKLADLADVQGWVLRRLLRLPDPTIFDEDDGPVILATRELSPGLAAELERDRVVGIATDLGTRTSHGAILARSLGIPAVVNLGACSDVVRNGQEVILDGRTGHVIVDPSDSEKAFYRERDFHLRNWEQELLVLTHLESRTADGKHIDLRVNIDLPAEAAAARDNGAEGVGLFRTEFLVVGKHASPREEEQFEAYRSVLETFDGLPVVVRTFDLGGDKFPAFLHMPKEDNPFLGWRAIRVCLDEPELFRMQLRAILRAASHGDLRVMLPLVNELREIEATREIIEEITHELRSEGHAVPEKTLLGIMIETPAAAMSAVELARAADFFSVGTNDLVQYTLAVDRGNARLAHLFNPFHPGVVRLLDRVARAAEAEGIEAGVCGELAAHPLGAFLLIGLGYDSLSVGPASLPEVKKVIRAVRNEDARKAAAAVLEAGDADEVISILRAHLPRDLDLSLFAGSWNLKPEAAVP